MSEEGQTATAPAVYNAPINSYGGSILVLTNPEDIIFKLELALRNQRLDRNGNIIGGERPLLNETGINSIISIAQSIINQDTIMSNLNKYEIGVIIEKFADAIITDLLLNGYDYGIRDIATANRVKEISENMAYICLKRSYEGDDKRFWKGSQMDITQRVEGAEKKGILGFWGGRKSK